MEYLDDDPPLYHSRPVNIQLLDRDTDLASLQQENVALREKVARLEDEVRLLKDALMY